MTSTYSQYFYPFTHPSYKMVMSLMSSSRLLKRI